MTARSNDTVGYGISATVTIMVVYRKELRRAWEGNFSAVETKNVRKGGVYYEKT